MNASSYLDSTARVLTILIILVISSASVDRRGNFRRVPLEILLRECPASVASVDIGPCLSSLMTAYIEASKPSFAKGIKIGGRRRIIEPLKLKDIKEKQDKAFKISAKDLRVHGISTISVTKIVFSPANVSIGVHFDDLEVRGKLKMTYSFLTAQPKVSIIVRNLNVTVAAKWGVEHGGGDRLDITFSNSHVKLAMERIGIKISGLGSLGKFLQEVVNRHQGLMQNYFIKAFEKDLSEKMNEELNRVKIAS